MSKSLALLDSNILVFASVSEHPYHDVAFDLVKSGVQGVKPYALAEQNLLEWYSVITSSKQRFEPLTPNDAQKVLSGYQSSRLTIVRPNQATFVILQEILNQTPPANGKDIYDRYLAATVLSNGIDTILTDNVKDFTNIPGLTAINPFR